MLPLDRIHPSSDRTFPIRKDASRFLRRVHAGDTLYAVLEVSELVPSIQTGLPTLTSTVHNQHSKLVMEGVQKYVLRRRPARVAEA